jgi:hypothetical protein
MIRPQFIIARFVIKNIIKFMGGDSTFIKIFKALFSIVPSLIITAGIIPTMSVL